MLVQNQTCWLEIFDGNQPMGEELLFLSKNDKILKNRATWFLKGIVLFFYTLICELG